MPGAHVTGRTRRHLLVATVAGLNALGAALGAVGLATGWLDLGATVTARLPWGSALVGAVALAVIVALPNAALTVLALRGDARCGPLSIVVGLLLIGWIVFQLAFIREFSFFHPLSAGIGLLLVWLGTRIAREDQRWALRPPDPVARGGVARP